MATEKELLNPYNRFTFRGETYRMKAYCFEPSVEMVNDFGDTISFSVFAPIKDEFILETS